MVKVAELTTDLKIRGNAAKALGKFRLSITDVKSGLDLLVGGVRIAGRAIAAFTTDMADAGDQAAKTAKNLSIGVQAVQELDFAAKISGVGINEVRTAIQRMQKGLNDARRMGTGPFADSLEQMGLTLEEFEGLQPDEIFQKLSGVLAGVTDATTRAALAQDLFGRGGKTLLPLINEGADGIAELRDRFQELGGGFSDDGAANAELFNDSMTELNTVIDSVKISIGEELFPVMIDIITELREWALANRELIKEETLKFIDEMVVLVRELAPSVRELLPILADFAVWAADTIKEFRELDDTLRDISENLDEEWGPAWTVARLALTAIFAPLLLATELIRVLIGFSDDLFFNLNRLKDIPGLLPGGAELPVLETGVRTRGGESEEEAIKRIEADRQAQAAAKEKKEIDDLFVGDKSSRDLSRIAKDRRKSSDVRATAALLVGSTAAEENRFEEIGGESKKTRQARLDRRKIQVGLLQKTRPRGKKRRGRKGGKDKKTKAARQFEDFLNADKLKQRVAEGEVTPTILVTVTNFNVTQDIDSPISIQGLSSTTAGEVLRMIRDQFDDLFEGAVRRGIQDLESPTVR